MNSFPPGRNNVLQKATVVAAFLVLISAALARAQSRHLSNVVAFLGPDQKKFVWEVDDQLLKDLAQLDDLEPLDARILSDAFLSAALRGDKGDKKKCCYEKVAEGIWSCCDGTFVGTGAKSIGKLFDLAQQSLEKDKGPEDLAQKYRPLLSRFTDANVFKTLGQDDPQMRFIRMVGGDSLRVFDCMVHNFLSGYREGR